MSTATLLVVFSQNMYTNIASWEILLICLKMGSILSCLIQNIVQKEYTLQFSKIMTPAKYIFSFGHFCLPGHNWFFWLPTESKTLN